MSLRDKIKNSDDIPVRPVPVPEWDVEVLVKGMNGTQRAAFVQRYADGDGKIQFDELYPELIIAGTFDPAKPSEKVFTEEDRSWLMSKSGAALERISKTVMNLSGMGEDSKNEAGKDSSSESPSDGSTTESPETSAA